MKYLFFQEQNSDSSQQYQIRDLNLKNLIIAIDRTGVSIRNAAIIANAVLQDAGLITSKNTSLVIDKSKICREREKYHQTLEDSTHSSDVPLSVYFDGRKDKNGKNYRQEIREEHVVLIKEPGGVYLTHVTPKSGTAKDLFTAISEYLATHSTSHLGKKIFLYILLVLKFHNKQ